MEVSIGRRWLALRPIDRNEYHTVGTRQGWAECKGKKQGTKTSGAFSWMAVR